jgi:hypothetical protein
MAVDVVVLVVAVPVDVVVPVEVVAGAAPVVGSASRLNEVPWRRPETTAAAWVLPPRKPANSAASFDSVVDDVPISEGAVEGLVVAVVVVFVAVVVVDVASAPSAGKAAAIAQASSREHRCGVGAGPAWSVSSVIPWKEPVRSEA